MFLKKVVAATKIIGCLMALTAFDVIADDVTLTVTNLVMRQRYPWNGLVDIDCEVICSDPATNVNLYLSAKDNVANRPLAMRRVWLENDVTHTNALEVKAGKHRLVWDAGADAPNIVSTNVAVSLQAFVGSGLYMVIDLSGGPDAVNYPVSYLGSVPQGGWSDEYKTTKLVLRQIQPGTFVMGCDATEIGYRGNETTLHQVVISHPFYIGIFQITQKQYQLVTGVNPSASQGDMRPVEQVSWNMVRGQSETYNWPNVRGVSINSFAGKLQMKTGLFGFDLPTEAQWEYSCRAGTTTALNSGMNLINVGQDPNMDVVGRYEYNGDGHTIVGSYLPNAWGIYDMHGNVWERCLDWGMSGGEFASDTATDPEGPMVGTCRVSRGGSKSCSADQCRSSYRIITSEPSGSWGDGGFRICCHSEAHACVLASKATAMKKVQSMSQTKTSIRRECFAEDPSPIK